jgi:hypothetical protein
MAARGTQGATVGIIGSAGRKADAKKMTKEIFYAMMGKAEEVITRDFKLDLGKVRLISGGAAWAGWKLNGHECRAGQRIGSPAIWPLKYAVDRNVAQVHLFIEDVTSCIYALMTSTLPFDCSAADYTCPRASNIVDSNCCYDRTHPPPPIATQ